METIVLDKLTEVLVMPAVSESASNDDASQTLLDKIAARHATVAVIGLGYVGLPLALAFAESGLRVVGIDVDMKKVASLCAGRSYIGDVSDERLRAALTGAGAAQALPAPTFAASDLLAQSVNAPADGYGRGNGNGHHADASIMADTALVHPARDGAFGATTDFDALCEVDAAIICVPTPVNQFKDPDLSYIIAATDQIAKRLHQGMLIVLESTTYPGTTEEVVLPRLEATGLKLGRDFFLGFSPERIDPGRVDWTVLNTPKVISGMTPSCLQIARALYGCAIQNLVPVANPRTAEMVKLYENTFRAVNIGLANEMAIICERMGIDVWEVIQAAATKPYGFTPFYPGPGIGGHCIPVDPLYLSWKLQALNYRARFIETADEVNSHMPFIVRDRVVNALNDDGRALKGSRVLVLGVAYKADIDDVRESPALELIHLLIEKGAHVEYCDPHVPSVRIGDQIMASVAFGRAALEWADCVVIATSHRAFDWRMVTEYSRLIIDTRNATKGYPPSAARIVKL